MTKANTRVTPDSYMELLRNQIDITRVPFSDRGSRILVFQVPGRSHLYIKLAERLLGLEPGLEDYFHRPPFIDDLRLVDDGGNALEFGITTSPERLQFDTTLGDFQLVFQDSETLAFGLPPGKTCGLRFRLRKEYCNTAGAAGELRRAIRNLRYASNGQIVAERVQPLPRMGLMSNSWSSPAMTALSPCASVPTMILIRKFPPFRS